MTSVNVCTTLKYNYELPGLDLITTARSSFLRGSSEVECSKMATLVLLIILNS